MSKPRTPRTRHCQGDTFDFPSNDMAPLLEARPSFSSTRPWVPHGTQLRVAAVARAAAAASSDDCGIAHARYIIPSRCGQIRPEICSPSWEDNDTNNKNPSDSRCTHKSRARPLSSKRLSTACQSKRNRRLGFACNLITAPWGHGPIGQMLGTQGS